MAWSQPQSQPRTRTLLVVDDREANLVAMEALLGDGDWQVHTVNSGEAALQALLDLDVALSVRERGVKNAAACCRVSVLAVLLA